MKHIIDGKEISTNETSLKNLLLKEGYFFPCGGKGICGKCKIIARGIAPSALDARFFTQAQIDEGLRLACDKTIDSSTNIKCLFQRTNAVAKLSTCSIAVILRETEAEIAILEDEIAEVVTLPYGDKPLTMNILRAVIGKNSIELFEKYSVAKAETIAIAASSAHLHCLLGFSPDENGGILDAFPIHLPAESLYILPHTKNLSGEDICASFSIAPPITTVAKACNSHRLRIKLLQTKERAKNEE